MRKSTEKKEPKLMSFSLSHPEFIFMFFSGNVMEMTKKSGAFSHVISSLKSKNFLRTGLRCKFIRAIIFP